MTAFETPNLDLPLIAPAQAQKHVTHNEALAMLDALIQLAVAAIVSIPPAAPQPGDRYIVGATPSGAFAGRQNAVAAFDSGAWRFLSPASGWLAWNVATSTFLVFDGGAWIDAPARAASMFGIGAAPSAVNRLAVASEAALFTHAGAGVQLKLNKSAAADTASLLYQSAFAGRAEAGLCGDDNFHLKVSADGAAWREALTVDAASGAVSLPFGIASGDRTGFRNKLRNAAFAINQRACAGAVSLAAGAYGHDGVKAGSGGAVYTFAASGVDTVIAVSSGSIILPVEANLIEGGGYRIAHDGTAAVRVWQGTGFAGSGTYLAAGRAAGGAAIGPLTAAVQTNVEFSAGTVLRPQLEQGAATTTFERRPHAIELFLCQRYY